MAYDTQGLNQRQIDRLNYLQKSKGYTGSKLTALSNEFRKKNAANPALLGNQQDNTPITDQTSSVNDSTGGINTNELMSDIPQIQDSNAAQQKAFQANYDFLTKDLEQRKAFDMEQQKQELANRGIPYDPSDPSSLYGRTVQGVTKSYDGLYNDAKNQALMSANQTASTNAGIDASKADSFLKGIGLSSGANQGVYGINQQKLLEEQKIKLQREALNKARSGGGGGGGGDSGSGFSIGGSIVE